MKLRFAPSPTGYLHIGNARTAIANFLIAEKNNAGFVLRIEDTDMERSSKESEQSIMEDLKWLGLRWTEGPDIGGDNGPYRQSERFDIYKEYTEKLLARGDAYHCFCSTEELDKQRKEAEANKTAFVYPGTCRNLTAEQKNKLLAEGKKPVIRFKVPAGETVVVNDLIKGDVTFNSENIGGDFIIVRSDGTPIYNYIVTIDDALMGITHVVRGEDHLSNTPKQILVCKALELPVPHYAHHALVLGEDRSKLSKRHGITSVELYRKAGYLPDALINYIALLGLALESGEEIVDRSTIIKNIEITNLAKTAAVFDFQKLRWMNAQYIRSMGLAEITDLFIPYIEEAGYNVKSQGREHLEKMISILRNYCDILSDIKNWLGLFLDDISIPDEETDALLKEEESQILVRAAYELLQSEFTEDNLFASLIPAIKEKTGLKGKKLFMPTRALVTGRLKGPELDIAMPVIGFENIKKRIEYCYKTYCQ